MLEQIEPYLLPIIGVLIMAMLSVITYFIKKWMAGVVNVQEKILKSIDGIKQEISETKIDMRFQDSYIREIESRMVEKQERIEARTQLLKDDVINLKEQMLRIKLFHNKNHPTDNV